MARHVLDNLFLECNACVNLYLMSALSREESDPSLRYVRVSFVGLIYVVNEYLLDLTDTRIWSL